MNGLSINEMNILLKIFKDFNNYYNANNLSKFFGLSSMGVLKILNNLEKQGLVVYDLIGKAKIYRINFKKEYTRQYISFLLRKEAEESNPKIKRWLIELRKLESLAKIGILFGSLLKNNQYNDVDVLSILKQSQINGFNKKIKELNQINVKRIHPIKQSIKDLKDNLAGKDKIIISALREGVVLFGYNKIVEVVGSVTH